jgi:hypothetical protein
MAKRLVHWHWSHIDRADKFHMSGVVHNESIAWDRAEPRKGMVWRCEVNHHADA